MHAAQFGDADQQLVWDLALDADGDLVLTGAFRGAIDTVDCGIANSAGASADHGYDAF